MNIPRFPQFKVTREEDFKVLDVFLSSYAPYSDFNAVSMLCWNFGDDNSYTFLNGNLVIRLRDYLSTGYNYSILGVDAIDVSIKILLDSVGELRFVPDVVIDSICDTDSLIMNMDRDSFDYVLSVSDMAHLTGKIYKNLRKHIRSFENKHPSLQIKKIELSDTSILQELESLTVVWCRQKGFSGEKTDGNLQSIRRFCRLSGKRDTVSIGVYVNKELIGFTLNERVNSDWFMGHFGHSNNEIKYSSLYSEYITAVLLSKLKAKYINIQQDTGLLGLRRTKSLYHPTFFLKKYTVQKAVG